MEKEAGYKTTIGDVATVGDNMATVGDNMTTIGVKDVEKEMTMCLTGDAKAVARVCTDIVSWTGPQPMERSSWRYPGQTLSLQVYLRDPPPGSRLRYTPALEQTIDIVRIFLDLIVNYMNRMPNMTEAFPNSEITTPSRRLSLSALVWMLWARVKTINSHLCQQTLKIMDVDKEWKHQFVQTHESSLGVCETCQTSQEMVSQLLAVVEALCAECKIKNAAIPRTKKEMEVEIYYITQWGAMRKWCDAILNDVTAIGNLAKDMRNQSLKLGNQLRNFRYETLSTVSKLQDLNKEKEELIVTTEKAVESRASSVMRVNELSKKFKSKAAECDEWKTKYLESEVSMVNLKHEVRELKRTSVTEKEINVNLCQELQRKTDQIEDNKMEINRMKREFSSRTYSLKDDVASRDLTISNQLDKIKNLEDRLKEMENHYGELKRELKKEQAHGAEIWKSFEELKIQKQNQDAQMENTYAEMDEMMRRLNEVEDNILSMPKSRELTVTGDPVRDMICKKTRNQATIRHLKQQNYQMSRSLIKMYAVPENSDQSTSIDRSECTTE